MATSAGAPCGLLALSPAADEPWQWALLAQAPTPAPGRRLMRSAVSALLARHRIRRLTAEAVHAALPEPALPVVVGTRPAAQEHVELLLPRLQLVHEQRARCERRPERGLQQLAAPAALRGVADRLLNVLITMLVHHTLYDPQRRRQRIVA